MSEGTDEVNLQILVDNKPTTIALHRSLSELLLELLRVVGSGDAVTLVPVHQQLTTQQAADILNVSRPYLIKLLEEGVMDHYKVGRHRRIRAHDVFAYKQRWPPNAQMRSLIWPQRTPSLFDECSQIDSRPW